MLIERYEKDSRGRVLVQFDDGSRCRLEKSTAEAYSLSEGAEIAPEDWEGICAEELLPEAKDRVLDILERADRTERQLREKLRADLYPEEVVGRAIEFAKHYGYLDDARYAGNYVRRFQGEKSTAEMRSVLRQRGIAGELIDRAFEEELTEQPEDVIRRWLEKKHYDAESAGEKEKRKVFQFLLRKGFRSEEIRRCMDL